MSDSEKSFPCPSTGCDMSFTNEDNLSIHKKKHDMVLNLGSSGKNISFVDQTPTPTRFIRNCEEMGLFQDLNPFEETFRRAVEAGNTGSLTVPEAGITDDTLHTPHIFPHIADVLSGSSQILPENNVQECTNTISITEKSEEERNPMNADVCSTVKLTSGDTPDLMKTAASKTDELNTNSIIMQDTMTSKLPEASPQLSINGEEVQLLLKTADGKLLHLSAVPISESPNTIANTNRPKQQTVVIRTEPPLNCATKSDQRKAASSRLSLAKMKLKQVLTKNTNQSQRSPEINDKTEMMGSSKKENRSKAVDQLKRKEILERNRASSMRARAKRKAWIQQLERTVTNVNEANAALQMEVKALRAEVAKLKTLLLAHKDCSVTKAMQKGNGIILGPKIISVNPELLTVPISISNGNVPVKRPAPEILVAPKKKPTPTKNSLIFPKVDCNTAMPIAGTAIVKTLPTLKIMGVSQQFLASEKEEPKQILIVQNPPRKLGDTSPRPIIQINPNYEIENAKTAGT